MASSCGSLAPDPVDLALAQLAHEMWRQRMLQAGWRAAERYDASCKLHDALVPFDRLAPADRRSVILEVIASEIPQQLGALADYPRTGPAELTVKDMRPHLRVALTDDAREQGTVVSWEPDVAFTGCLRTIRVAWDSGEVIDHVAAERELVAL